MRHPADHGERAEECRRLAKLCRRPEEWRHFLEMAETWEMVLRHQNERSRRKQSLSGTGFGTFYSSQIMERKGRRIHVATKMLLERK